MFKGLHGLNPGNQAFKQFKCPVLNVLSTLAVGWMIRFWIPAGSRNFSRLQDSWTHSGTHLASSSVCTSIFLWV